MICFHIFPCSVKSNQNYLERLQTISLWSNTLPKASGALRGQQTRCTLVSNLGLGGFAWLFRLRLCHLRILGILILFVLLTLPTGILFTILILFVLLILLRLLGRLSVLGPLKELLFVPGMCNHHMMRQRVIIIDISWINHNFKPTFH